MISKELKEKIDQNLATFTLEELQILHLVLYGEPEQDLIAEQMVKRFGGLK